jgi:hypothetical protein
MEVSGHRTRATVDRYNTTRERDLREALVRTSEYVDSSRRIRRLRRFAEVDEGAVRFRESGNTDKIRTTR